MVICSTPVRPVSGFPTAIIAIDLNGGIAGRHLNIDFAQCWGQNDLSVDAHTLFRERLNDSGKYPARRSSMRCLVGFHRDVSWGGADKATIAGDSRADGR